VKIALVTHHVFKNDGQGRVNFELARYLAGRGHDVHLVAHGVADELLDTPGITALLLPRCIERPNPAKNILFLRQADGLLKKGCFDIIHAHGGVVSVEHHVNTAHFVHSWWQHSPFGARSEGVYLRLATRLYAGLEKKSYARARVVVAVSHKVKRELVQYAGVNGDKIRVVYNGIDSGEFSPAGRPAAREAVLKAWNIPPGKFVILFAGDLRHDRKGISSLLECLTRLEVDYHALILGSPAGSPFVGKALEMGLGDRITWAGFQKNISSYMRAADVFVYPTRTDSFPTVVMEALAAGTPVVVPGAKHCGVSELLQDKETALLVDNPWDARQIAGQVNLLARDQMLWQKLSGAGRRLAEQMPWRRMAEQYERIYLELLLRRD